MLILKSASPRRRQILENLKLQFQTKPSDVDEKQIQEESPLTYLKRVTIAKLEKEKAVEKNLYLSSDTIVVLDATILSKPTSFQDAVEILTYLSGKKHSVFSGLALLKNQELVYDFDETKVEFKNWSKKEIQLYIEEFQPYDKAGAYGIQDTKGPVQNFTGSYSNVLGFPLRKFYSHYTLWKEYLC